MRKTLPQPGNRHPTGAETSCLQRKGSPKEGLHSIPPTIKPAVADKWAPSNTQAKELLSVLKRNSHLFIREVETMGFRPPPTQPMNEPYYHRQKINWI
jgi:hypothetical protein